MGRKRITAVIEVTYDEDDPMYDQDDELERETLYVVRRGLGQRGAELAAFAVTNASVDPDPEPVIG